VGDRCASLAGNTQCYQLGHAAGIVLSGRHIESATIDPNEGALIAHAALFA
jgi:hypothetical protein